MAKKTVQEIIQRYNELELEITALSEGLGLLEQEFCSRDNIQPKSIVVTEEGRRVPAEVFNALISELRIKMLKPLEEELIVIKEMTVK